MNSTAFIFEDLGMIVEYIHFFNLDRYSKCLLSFTGNLLPLSVQKTVRKTYNTNIIETNIHLSICIHTQKHLPGCFVKEIDSRRDKTTAELCSI